MKHPDFTARLALVAGKEVATVQRVVRVLREAGVVPTGSRGRGGGAELKFRDGAAIAIGLLGYSEATTAAVCVPYMLDAHLHERRLVDPRTTQELLVDASEMNDWADAESTGAYYTRACTMTFCDTLKSICMMLKANEDRARRLKMQWTYQVEIDVDETYAHIDAIPHEALWDSARTIRSMFGSSETRGLRRDLLFRDAYTVTRFGLGTLRLLSGLLPEEEAVK